RYRTVGAFPDDTGPDAVAVGRRDLVLECGGDEDVAVQLEGGGGLGQVRGARIVEDGAGLRPVLDDAVDVEAVLVEDGALPLGQADDECAALLEEVGCVIADVAEALDDGALAFQPG